MVQTKTEGDGAQGRSEDVFVALFAAIFSTGYQSVAQRDAESRSGPRLKSSGLLEYVHSQHVVALPS